MWLFHLFWLPFHKLAFCCSAHGASPIVRQLFKGCLGRYFVFWVSEFWVVYVAADCAFPLVHFPSSLYEVELISILQFKRNITFECVTSLKGCFLLEKRENKKIGNLAF